MSATLTDTARELTHDLSRAVRAESGERPRALAAADVLPTFLADTDLLADEQRVGDPEAYRQHILHVEDDGLFSVVALVWLPGQVTPIHDHVSWCVVGVYEGNEEEEVFALSDDGLRRRAVNRNPVGTVSALTPPGDIHRVRNTGDGTTISIHVYGADIFVLGSSIRRRYDLPVLG